MQNLKNKYLSVRINPLGAELCSITNNETGLEYLWQADPKFWKRHSPVLFPIVGSLWNGEYRHTEETYKMSQHGFARDLQFELIEKTTDSVSYMLKSNKSTLENYPFEFELLISYKLVNNKIEVTWNVKNTGSETLFFQIGAHPAFYYPDFDTESDLRGYFAFGDKANLNYKLIKEKGCLDADTSYTLDLDSENLLPIQTDTFEQDALIFEDSQINKVTLLNKAKVPHLTLHFDAPVLGLWSQKDRECPFVCIEPWYGRCDRINYIGDFSHRDWMNRLSTGESFEKSYTIEIHL